MLPSMPTKQFRAALNNRQGADLPFEVIGLDGVVVDTFVLHLPLPGLAIMEMAEGIDMTAGVTRETVTDAAGMAVMRAALGYMRNALGADWARFAAAVNTARLDIEQLMAVMQWMVEESSGFPTQPPQNSPPSLSISSPTSTPDLVEPVVAPV
jgi:hypothetical protein